MQVSPSMEPSRRRPSRRLLTAVVAGVIVIAVLAGAAFLYGNVLKADTSGSNTQSVAPASASFSSDSLGAAAVRQEMGLSNLEKRRTAGGTSVEDTRRPDAAAEPFYNDSGTAHLKQMQAQ